MESEMVGIQHVKSVRSSKKVTRIPRAKKPKVSVKKEPTIYDDEESNVLARLFRTLDARKDRLHTLLCTKSVIDQYHFGHDAQVWHRAIDVLIKIEKANPRPVGL